MTRCVAAVAALLALVASAAHATAPGGNGLIAFYRVPPIGPSGIYVIDPAGGGERLLRQESPDEGFQGPAWSPDGSRIAYTVVHQVDGRYVPDIAIMSGDGTGAHRVTSTHDAVDPAWSPDGSMIAFRTQTGSPQRRPYQHVWFMNADGSDMRPLAYGHDPDWSPDCTTVALAGGGIRTVAANRTERRLTADAGDGLPTWSPDGRLLAFLRFGPDGGALHVINADGTGERRLASILQEPAWSPDGRQIAFVDELVNVAVMNADGTGRRPLTTTGPAFLNVQPDWQPLPTGRPDPHACDSWRAVAAGPALRVSIRPRRARVGVRTRFRVRVTAVLSGRRGSVHGVLLRLAGREAHTGTRGRAVLTRRFRRPGRYRITAAKPGYTDGAATVRVVRR